MLSTRRSGFRVLVIVSFVGLCAPSAQARYDHTDASGIERSQYANIAPLPGAGIAINADGELDGQGAFQINIPVAYTPGWGYVAAGVYAGAHVGAPSTEFGNGSGVFGVGFFGRPAVFVSAMQVSRLFGESKAVSAQVGLLSESATAPALAVGEQDVLDKEPYGRSPYLVLTRSLKAGNRSIYATLGYGGGRFTNKPFGGVSVPFGGMINLAVEHDGYQFNSGLGWRPGGRSGKLTFIGAYNAKAGWLAGISVSAEFRRGN